jgi:hypothetical protein
VPIETVLGRRRKHCSIACFQSAHRRAGTFRAKLQNSHLCGLPESCGASARSLFATVRNPHHRRLMRLKNRLSISVTSVTMGDDRTIRKLGSTFSGKSHVRFVIALAERPVPPERLAVFISDARHSRWPRSCSAMWHCQKKNSACGFMPSRADDLGGCHLCQSRHSQLGCRSISPDHWCAGLLAPDRMLFPLTEPEQPHQSP